MEITMGYFQIMVAKLIRHDYFFILLLLILYGLTLHWQVRKLDEGVLNEVEAFRSNFNRIF